MTPSSGTVTNRSTSSGATPEYWVTTVIMGNEMSGNISRGRRVSDRKPKTMTMRMSMVMVTRLLTENSTSGFVFLCGA